MSFRSLTRFHWYITGLQVWLNRGAGNSSPEPKTSSLSFQLSSEHKELSRLRQDQQEGQHLILGRLIISMVWGRGGREKINHPQKDWEESERKTSLRPEIPQGKSCFQRWGPRDRKQKIRIGPEANQQLLFCCSIAKSCPTLCNPMDCSTPGFPVFHYLLEFAQTPVHWVGDVIQPSRPLSPASPPAFYLSQR